MPLYEYQCDACGARFELIRKFSDPPLSECPKCGSDKVHKLISSPAFQFKGSGWYITDYARKSDAGSGDKTSESKPDSTAKPEPAKPAAESGGSAEKSASTGPAPAAKDKPA